MTLQVRLPSRVDRLDQHHPFAGFVVRCLLVLCGYVLLDFCLRRVTHLAFADYAQPFLLLRVLHPQALANLAMLALLAAATVLPFVGAHLSWRELDPSQALRLIASIALLILTWSCGLYSRNGYFDRPHVVDRLVLLLFALGALISPQLIVPFLLEAYVLTWQFDYPLVGQFSWVESALLFRTLTVIAALLIARTLFPRVSLAHGATVLLCLIASQYFASGVGKIAISWLMLPNLHYSIGGGYAIGWLASLTPAQIAALITALRPVVPVLMLAALAIETGACMLFLHPVVTRRYFLFAAAFHMLVLLMIGIAFWKWAAVELAVVWAVRQWQRARVLPVGRRLLLFSISLIVLGPLWSRPTNLSWFDTPLNYVYRIEAQGRSGRVYVLKPADFAPYDAAFTFRNFSFISEQPVLTGPYGVTFDRSIAAHLSAIAAAEDADPREAVMAFERERGRVAYVADMAARFDDFIRTWLRHWYAGGGWRSPLDWIRPPTHLWTWLEHSDYDGQEAIVSVRVYEDLRLTRRTDIVTLRTRLVRTVAVDAP